jgi:hypothetical protein
MNLPHHGNGVVVLVCAPHGDYGILIALEYLKGYIAGYGMTWRHVLERGKVMPHHAVTVRFPVSGFRKD